MKTVFLLYSCRESAPVDIRILLDVFADKIMAEGRVNDRNPHWNGVMTLTEHGKTTVYGAPDVASEDPGWYLWWYELEEHEVVA